MTIVKDRQFFCCCCVINILKTVKKLTICLVFLHLPSPVGKPRADGMTDVGGGAGVDTISHSLSVVQRLEALLLQANGSDVSLRVETPNADEVKVMQAHSLILSLQSSVFEELLLSRNGSTLVLKESSDCAAVFDKFIR